MKKTFFIILTLYSTSVMADFCLKAKQEGYPELRNATMFTSDAIGFAGEKPKWYEEYESILDDTKREALFESLMSHAAVPAQLYGLMGLRVIESDKYRSYVTK